MISIYHLSLKISARSVVLLLGIIFTQVVLLAQEPDRVKAELFREIDAVLQKARQEEVPVFAPTFFAKTQEFYHRAEADYRKGERIDKIRQQLQQTVRTLNQAIEIAKGSKVVLAEASDTRNKANQLEYKNIAPKEFAKAERDYREAILKAEAADMRAARERAERAMQGYREATLLALERGPIRDAEVRLKQSQKTLTRENYDKAARDLGALKRFTRNTKRQKFDIIVFTGDFRVKVDEIFSIVQAPAGSQIQAQTGRPIKEAIQRRRLDIEQSTRTKFKHLVGAIPDLSSVTCVCEVFQDDKEGSITIWCSPRSSEAVYELTGKIAEKYLELRKTTSAIGCPIQSEKRPLAWAADWSGAVFDNGEIYEHHKPLRGNKEVRGPEGCAYGAFAIWGPLYQAWRDLGGGFEKATQGCPPTWWLGLPISDSREGNRVRWHQNFWYVGTEPLPSGPKLDPCDAPVRVDENPCRPMSLEITETLTRADKPYQLWVITHDPYTRKGPDIWRSVPVDAEGKVEKNEISDSWILSTETDWNYPVVTKRVVENGAVQDAVKEIALDDARTYIKRDATVGDTLTLVTHPSHGDPEIDGLAPAFPWNRLLDPLFGVFEKSVDANDTEGGDCPKDKRDARGRLSVGDWCGCNTIGLGESPDFQWQPIENRIGLPPFNRVAKGWLLEWHEATVDMPFNHPFINRSGTKPWCSNRSPWCGSKDIDAILAVGSGSMDLLGVGNRNKSVSNWKGREALKFELDRKLWPEGVLPSKEKMTADPNKDDSKPDPLSESFVQLRGQWIVDCGHADNPYGFHTEIHPPTSIAWSVWQPGNVKPGLEFFEPGTGGPQTEAKAFIAPYEIRQPPDIIRNLVYGDILLETVLPVVTGYTGIWLQIYIPTLSIPFVGPVVAPPAATGVGLSLYFPIIAFSDADIANAEYLLSQGEALHSFGDAFYRTRHPSFERWEFQLPPRPCPVSKPVTNLDPIATSLTQVTDYTASLASRPGVNSQWNLHTGSYCSDGIRLSEEGSLGSDWHRHRLCVSSSLQSSYVPYKLPSSEVERVSVAELAEAAESETIAGFAKLIDSLPEIVAGQKTLSVSEGGEIDVADAPTAFRSLSLTTLALNPFQMWPLGMAALMKTYVNKGIKYDSFSPPDPDSFPLVINGLQVGWRTPAVAGGAVRGSPGQTVDVPIFLGCLPQDTSSQVYGVAVKLELSSGSGAGSPSLRWSSGPESVRKGPAAGDENLSDLQSWDSGEDRIVVVTSANALVGPGVLAYVPVTIPSNASLGTEYRIRVSLYETSTFPSLRGRNGGRVLTGAETDDALVRVGR
jgi:hypothetical protein